MEHELKVKPEYYHSLFTGEKTCEVRYNDRDFQVGDVLILHCIEPTNRFLIDMPLFRTITYVLKGGQYGIHSEYVVLSIHETEENLKSQRDAIERNINNNQQNITLFLGCIAVRRFSTILNRLSED
ncbi:MAG: DUF3850 domain-containing protein [Bacteroidia bacterium]|nr:DUF3850 domain-containing protein [Bacteroidia bacterium]